MELYLALICLDLAAAKKDEQAPGLAAVLGAIKGTSVINVVIGIRSVDCEPFVAIAISLG